MNRVRAWVAAAAVAATGSAIAADPPAESKPWLNRVFAGKSAEAKPAEPKPADTPAKPAPTPARPPVILAPLAPEVLAEAVRAEEQACTRRLDVCAKLRQLAADKNDDKLLRQIDELEKQAIELCQGRVARMGVRAATGRVSARAVLDQELGTGAAVNPLAVAPPTPAAKTPTADARGGR